MPLPGTTLTETVATMRSARVAPWPILAPLAHRSKRPPWPQRTTPRRPHQVQGLLALTAARGESWAARRAFWAYAAGAKPGRRTIEVLSASTETAAEARLGPIPFVRGGPSVTRTVAIGGDHRLANSFERGPQPLAKLRIAQAAPEFGLEGVTGLILRVVPGPRVVG